MKQPSTLYVAQVLREKKLFTSELNFKHPKKWTLPNCREWMKITGQRLIIPPPPESNLKTLCGKKSVRVMRMDDGHEFTSVMECIRSEGFHRQLMQQLLKDGIKYKRL
jgi:hypothetical protein